MNTIDTAARWRPGLGKAHLNAAHWSEPFKRLMVGTFNVETVIDITAFPPAFTALKGYHKFWLVRLDGEHYGWAMRWDGTRQPGTRLEVVSKRAFPQALRERPFRLEVHNRMSPAQVEAWIKPIKFFQTFSWVPAQKRRSDSALVYDTVRTRFDPSGKEVLDIGCNFGYHSFRASGDGAHVLGLDRNPNVIRVAQLINDRIELQDCLFRVSSQAPEPLRADVVFCFSVLHQEDPTYRRLAESIRILRRIAREAAYLELIVPALSGGLTEGQIDKIVDGLPLLSYKHRVRATRKIYELRAA